MTWTISQKLYVKGVSTNEGWIDFDGRQETTGTAFPTISLPTTGVFLDEPRRNLKESIAFVAFVS